MTSLVGVRVLVVEDEGPVALMIQDMLEDMGCVVVDSAATVSEALRCVERGDFEFAVLDRNLKGASAEPVAEALVKRGVPFTFASGYGHDQTAPHLRNRPALQKPFTAEELKQVLCTSLRDRR